MTVTLSHCIKFPDIAAKGGRAARLFTQRPCRIGFPLGHGVLTSESRQRETERGREREREGERERESVCVDIAFHMSRPSLSSAKITANLQILIVTVHGNRKSHTLQTRSCLFISWLDRQV